MKKKCTIIFYSLLLIFLYSITVSKTYAATLQVNPSSGNFNVGDLFTVTIKLDTQGTGVDGVDVHYLHYDPTILETQSTSLIAGSLFPNTLVNSINAGAGTINFSQIISGGAQYTGTGTLATVQFKTLQAGTATLTFDAVPGSTIDTNVSSFGTEVLTSVTNGSYTITTSSAPTPQPTATPTPSTSNQSSSNSSSSSSSSNNNNSSSNSSSSSNNNSSSPSSNSSSSAPSYVFTRNLYLGIRGEDVKKLQELLVKEGVYPQAVVSGYYGAFTTAAVKRFQQKHGISPVGYVGSVTRGKLNEAAKWHNITTSTISTTPSTNNTASSGTLTRNLLIGARGGDVIYLQRCLIKEGVYPQAVVSGYYGAFTTAAVKRFQQKYGISPVGYVGSVTRGKLLVVCG